ncbi:GerMN domain-containing protein [Streptomyces sp. NPDC058773]|uniref:GerMN domain-containing protein n=1 Tax=Streptomyces sp. NPDC058773 TaxID=3346632 RepID=UPI00367E7F70
MTRTRLTLLCCVLALLGAGCGVQPTGVMSGGRAPSGISQGMRVYFASDRGLRGAPRPDVTIDQLEDVLKLLMAGPTAQERAAGLTNLVQPAAGLRVTAHLGQVTVHTPGRYAGSPRQQATGQLVCTLARAEVLVHGTRPDKVQVTVVGQDGPAGPYQCQQFLSR